MTKKVTSISNGLASILGMGMLYLAEQLESESIKIGIMAITPGLTLYVAYLSKLVGNISSLGAFKLLMSLSTNKQLKQLRKALDDPYISPEMKKKLQSKYDETYKLSVDIVEEDITSVGKWVDSARDNLNAEMKKDYRDNKDLTASLAAQEKEKSSET
ncbi:hypothetical protein CWB99_15900 [Pseudoalteromonas rubra]|uniref:Uncharacterized protein n=1 Tax=Pseudoalteromonas rubra TaxID=43658 RepID=A0A5S3WIV4_9GAMM|nr:hypothetical protein [Pseudoalteromonas rubra]TMP27199.1 hypothetical protein CWB99_15900 [Pseudoalteromonas rubra]TMP29495.1 hypothetical protein CWC00_18995 [Pseudoalteromonas rubra]